MLLPGLAPFALFTAMARANFRCGRSGCVEYREVMRDYFQRVWWIHADAEALVTLWMRVEGWKRERSTSSLMAVLRGPMVDPPLSTSRKVHTSHTSLK